jgi:hypothetical protein
MYNQQINERREDHHEEVVLPSASEAIGVTSLGSLLRKLKPSSSSNKNQDESNTILTDIDEMTQDSPCSSSSSAECQSYNTKKNEAPKHHDVSFNSRVARRIFTISRKDFTLEEKEAIWWTNTDYIGFLGSCVKQIAEMENGVVFKDRKYCSRGLEGQTRLGHIAKTTTRSESIDAVLDQQDYLREMKVDPMDQDVSIAQVCRLTTSSCQLWACIVGLADARAAAAAVDEDDLVLLLCKEDSVAHVLENMLPVRFGHHRPPRTVDTKPDRYCAGNSLFLPPKPAATGNRGAPPCPPQCDHAKTA